MEARNPIRLLFAMMQGVHSHHGTVAIEQSPCQAAACMREVANALDWRVETFEASHVNLNDLEARDSPLSQSVRHAISSEHTYVFVMQGFPPEAMQDMAYVNRLSRIARNLRIVLAMEGPPAQLHGWRLADLRG